MTDQDHTKKPRRRGRRGGKGRRKIGKPSVSQNNDFSKADQYDVQAETAEIKASENNHKNMMADADHQLDVLLPKLLRQRDLTILDWLCSSLAKSRAEIIRSMLTQAIVRERRAYREAHGGGGASSTNLETLSERLPVRK